MWNILVSEERREELKLFFDFNDAEWQKVVHHVPTYWISLMSALDRLIQNWLYIKHYFENVNDCTKILINISVMEDPGKEFVIKAYLHYSPMSVQSAKTLDTANHNIMKCYIVMQSLDM